MSQERIIQLQKAVESREDQPFPFYALALEYKNIGEFENSQKFFEETLKRFPDYIPAYYHYGQLLELLSEPIQARQIYAEGIELAGREGDDHARSELMAALNNLSA